jgi:ACR3 family arsenite transporter
MTLPSAKSIPSPKPAATVVAELSWLDRLLPLWIFLAMGVGVGLGYVIPEIASAFDTLRIDTVSLPIAVGLLWMMYPVLAKVKYEKLGGIVTEWKLFGTSLILNWVIGPILMFTLAWLLLPDLPGYRTGLIVVGLARCIAMVLIWNMLAKGDNEIAAVLVALNSLFQIFMYSVLGYFYLKVVPGWLGTAGQALDISMWDIARSVLIFLGIPLLAGFLTRTFLTRKKGHDWYDTVFMPRLGPTAIIGLLFTIIVMFSMKGEVIVTLPLDVCYPPIDLLLDYVCDQFRPKPGAQFQLCRNCHPLFHSSQQQL